MDKCIFWTFIFCVGICVLLLALLISLDSLEPLEYGITYNKFSKRIGTEVYESGRYLIGPFQSFIVYPSNLITIEFSNMRKAIVSNYIIS